MSSPAPARPQIHPIRYHLARLQQTKPHLPYGRLICVAAAPSVTSTEMLLELADLVGPYIAIFLIQADVIDDWTPETGHKLTVIARKHDFILWEGGRVLNVSPSVVGKSEEERYHATQIMQRRYTKGIVQIASWAGLASYWTTPMPAEMQEHDHLIPALKSAARETVAKISRLVQTEITVEDDGQGSETASQTDNPARRAEEDLPIKFSNISMTQSITQSYESSDKFHHVLQESETAVNPGDGFEGAEETKTVSSAFHLARGLILALPAVDNPYPFVWDYRDSCLAAGRLNRDFVAGFQVHDHWTVVSRNPNILKGTSPAADPYGDKERQSGEDPDGGFIILSPLPGAEESYEADQIGAALEELIKKAIDATGDNSGPVVPPNRMLHIPVIPLGNQKKRQLS
ncbi:hypothetical protein VTN31DRAFT_1028 [Thermomyces dupontii]|uniref:uncharacterized protein n=1 Tax=Talaromyces thermophilus TaxID=28565 RepID=UPI0037425D4F